MQVFTPADVAARAANKYLGVLVAAKFARIMNEFPVTSQARLKKLTTQALEKLTTGEIEYRILPRRRG